MNTRSESNDVFLQVRGQQSRKTSTPGTAMAEAAIARKRSVAMAAKEGAIVAAKFDTSDEGNDVPGS